MTRSTWCKVCGARMWADDEDGLVYCPNCGWEFGTPVDIPNPVEDQQWPTE